jgi:hypothetical protein
LQTGNDVAQLRLFKLCWQNGYLAVESGPFWGGAVSDRRRRAPVLDLTIKTDRRLRRKSRVDPSAFAQNIIRAMLF